jgi:hypothetical protein
MKSKEVRKTIQKLKEKDNNEFTHNELAKIINEEKFETGMIVSYLLENDYLRIESFENQEIYSLNKEKFK